MAEGRRERGLEMLARVYAGEVAVPPEGSVPFADVMVEQLFAEVWSRGGLSIRDRRLLLLGAIAALGEREAWTIQVRSALRNGELTPEEVHEVLVQLAQYAGYPRLSRLVPSTLQVMAEVESEQSEGRPGS